MGGFYYFPEIVPLESGYQISYRLSRDIKDALTLNKPMMVKMSAAAISNVSFEQEILVQFMPGTIALEGKLERAYIASNPFRDATSLTTFDAPIVAFSDNTGIFYFALLKEW